MLGAIATIALFLTLEILLVVSAARKYYIIMGHLYYQKFFIIFIAPIAKSGTNSKLRLSLLVPLEAAQTMHYDT